ncbi:serine/threonine protein kinase [Persicobacter psychrovividus]|uniref:Serine/threonine protein kinase n=1 Tax=Persicobacter psychrovividus TaxID=387638 RepID=A0ABM7VA32_9BACT|nr:serine/threonine protein kinase [Persicobacter psychrovividus]
MHQDKHQKVSDIIAQVMDLPPELAQAKIDLLSEGDESVRKEVMSLLNFVEESPITKSGTTTANKTKSIIQRVGADTQFTSKKKISVLEQWRNQLLVPKRVRALALASCLLLISLCGNLFRSGVRREIINQQRKELESILIAQHKLLKTWVGNQLTEVSREVSDSTELHQTAVEILQASAQKPFIDRTFKVDAHKRFDTLLDKIKEQGNASLIAIIDLSGAVVAFHNNAVDSATEIEADSTLNHYIVGTYISKDLMGILSDLREGRSVFLPPFQEQKKHILIDNYNTYCYFCAPIYDEQRRIIGGVAVAANPQHQFSKLFNIALEGKGGESYAFDHEGRLISKTLTELDQVGLITASSDTIHHNSIQAMRDPEESSNYVRIVQRALEAKGTTSDSLNYGTVMEPYRNYAGKEMVGAWYWLPEYNFGVATEVEADEVFAPIRYIRIVYFPMFFVIIILSILLFNSNVNISLLKKKVSKANRMGHYMIKKKIGEGGFGEVYLAEHAFLRRPTAIKVLRKELIESEHLQRFEREVQMVARLSHPNTIRIYDYNYTKDGRFYYAMEFLDGISLQELVKLHGEQPIERVLHILMQVSKSLKEAHQMGLVHRDIKPQNIMLCKIGGEPDYIKVLDFGLVKDMHDEEEITQMNQVAGTPSYLAPERMSNPKLADHRVDIYSLGAIGFFLLGKKLLIDMLSQSNLGGKPLTKDMINIDAYQMQDLPSELIDFLFSCMAYDINDRPADINEVLMTIERLQERYHWTEAKRKEWWKKFDAYDV